MTLATEQYKEEILKIDFLSLLDAEPYIVRKLIKSKLLLKEEAKQMHSYLVEAYKDLHSYKLSCQVEEVNARINSHLLKEKLEKELDNENQYSSNRKKI